MIFRSKKGRARFAEGEAPVVRYQIAGKEIDLGRMNGKVEKLIRSQMEKQVLKFLDKHGDLKHPNTGEQPDFIFTQKKPGDMAIQMRLATDSPELIAWLASKGLAVEGGVEVVNEKPASEEVSGQTACHPSEAARPTI